MRGFLILSLVALIHGQVELPHGHELKQLVDRGFYVFDKNGDGCITLEEMVFVSNEEDANHDGMVTLEEYMTYFHVPREVAEPIFNVYDQDKDGLIANDHYRTNHPLIDANGDGCVNLQEYEHYMVGFVECVFGHGNHGHGADCSQ